MRFKRQIDFAKSSKTGQHVFIIPTDDSRLKIVVIPFNENSKEKIVEFMQSSIANIQEDTNAKKTELMLPAFSLDIT